MIRSLLTPIFIVIYFFNIGFINKNQPNLKGLICGSELYMNILKNNYRLEDIFSGDPQIELNRDFHDEEKYGDEESLFREGNFVADWMGNYLYWNYIDINTGRGYLVDYKTKIFTYMKPEITNNEPDDNDIDNILTAYKREGNKIIWFFNRFEFAEFVGSHQTTLYLSNMTIKNTWDNVERTCMFFPIPGIIQIVN